METLKKIFIWIAIMVMLIFVSDYCIHRILKTTQYNGEQQKLAYFNKDNINKYNINKDSLVVGFLVFLCLK